MGIAFIVKGNGRGLQATLSCLSDACAKAGVQTAAVAVTEYPRHAIELAARWRDEVDCLVAVGGDGTLNEVVQGVLQAGQGAAPVLGVLPAGTANDFLKSAAGSHGVEDCLARYVGQHWRAIDAGRVIYSDDSGAEQQRYFINAADIGIGAAVVQKLSARRGSPGANLHYLWAIFRTFARYRARLVQVTSDQGLAHQGKTLALLAGNGRYFGSGLCAMPQASLDSGQLEVTLIGDVSVVDFLRKLPDLRAGRPIDHPQVSYHRAGSLDVTASDEAVGVEVDGEYLGTTPVRIEALPAALRFLLP